MFRPIDVVENRAVEECGNYNDFTGKEFLDFAKDETCNATRDDWDNGKIPTGPMIWLCGFRETNRRADLILFFWYFQIVKTLFSNVEI